VRDSTGEERTRGNMCMYTWQHVCSCMCQTSSVISSQASRNERQCSLLYKVLLI